jgi:hypothetical protein
MAVLLFSVDPPLSAAGSSASDSLETLATRLIKMRGQVDELQSDLNIKREEHRNRMAYLAAQQSDLEATRNREELRVRQLEKEMEDLRARAAEAGSSSETLLPMVSSYILQLRQHVEKGFPFKRGDRVAALDEIDLQLNSGAISAQRAVNRLWVFIEDEIRLSRENAIYTQSIPLNGENVLVDVIKLGNAMMYFKTRDLKYGRAVETPSGWSFELLDSAKDQEQVAHLFDSLRKQIRQGYFQLPYAMPRSAGASS